jgi:vesicle transport protein SEC22
MPILTFVARASDSLLLVASFSHSTSSSISTETMDVFKSQAKQLLKTLNNRSTSKCSIESGSCVFHYMIINEVIFLTLSEKAYPKRLAFLYLDEISQGFVTELERDYGQSWRDKISTAARPYQFIKFDKFIQRKHKEYIDPSSRSNATKLSSDLTEIHSIMKKNIQEVLNRGEKLDNITNTSNSLVEESKKFKWGAKKLSFQALLNQYGPIAAIGVFVLFVFYWKFG